MISKQKQTVWPCANRSKLQQRFHDQPQQQSETEMLSKSLEQEAGEGTEVIFQGTIPKKGGSGSSAGGAASNNSSAPAQ